jgi:hypothetical protein
MQADNGRRAQQLIKNETFEHYAGEQRDEMEISRTKKTQILAKTKSSGETQQHTRDEEFGFLLTSNTITTTEVSALPPSFD